MLDGSMGTSMNEYGVPIKRQRITPPLSERVMLYVRQDNEDVYTALHVVPPTTNGLISAVSEMLLFGYENIFKRNWSLQYLERTSCLALVILTASFKFQFKLSF